MIIVRTIKVLLVFGVLVGSLMLVAGVNGCGYANFPCT